MNVKVLKLLPGLGLIFLTAPLLSQAAESDPIKDELVTTVRKTEESTLKVPLAITTFDEAEIEAALVAISGTAAVDVNGEALR